MTTEIPLDMSTDEEDDDNVEAGPGPAAFAARAPPAKAPAPTLAPLRNGLAAPAAAASGKPGAASSVPNGGVPAILQRLPVTPLYGPAGAQPGPGIAGAATGGGPPQFPPAHGAFPHVPGFVATHAMPLMLTGHPFPVYPYSAPFQPPGPHHPMAFAGSTGGAPQQQGMRPPAPGLQNGRQPPW
jgi:hypothetical protein